MLLFQSNRQKPLIKQLKLEMSTNLSIYVSLNFWNRIKQLGYCCFCTCACVCVCLCVCVQLIAACQPPKWTLKMWVLQLKITQQYLSIYGCNPTVEITLILLQNPAIEMVLVFTVRNFRKTFHGFVKALLLSATTACRCC